MMSRTAQWWEILHLRIGDDEKQAPRRFVAFDIDGERQGYAVYRTFFAFEGGLPGSRLVVREALGTTPQATAGIWRFLLDVDWMSVVEVPLAPPDHPLFLLLGLPRRAQYRMGDGLWVRLVDLPAALSGRTYARAARSCSRCATRSATGTTAAGGSTAAPASAPTASPTWRSTSRCSAPPTSAPSPSRSYATRDAFTS